MLFKRNFKKSCYIRGYTALIPCIDTYYPGIHKFFKKISLILKVKYICTYIRKFGKYEHLDDDKLLVKFRLIFVVNYSDIFMSVYMIESKPEL